MLNDVARVRLAVLLAGLAAAGCGGGALVSGGAEARDAGGEARASCPRHWTVSDTKTNPELAVTVADGALTIALPLAGDELVAVVHDGTLMGDFAVEVDFEAFMPGATAAYVQVAARVDVPAPGESPLIATGIGVDDGTLDLRALLLYTDPAATRFDLALTRAVQGTLRFARSGPTIVLTATTPSGESASVTSDVSPAPVTIGLQFASGANAAPTAFASVRLTDFRVVGGGGLAGDTFDCDSLL
jgi:hypothetical protein